MDVKICDACGKYFSIPTDSSFHVKGLGSVFFRVRYMKDGHTSYSRRDTDTCPGCSQKIRSFIADNFRSNLAEIMGVDAKAHIEQSKEDDHQEHDKEAAVLSEQAEREKKAVWEVEYGESVEWEDFRDNYFWCDRCQSYQKGQCLCYSR